VESVTLRRPPRRLGVGLFAPPSEGPRVVGRLAASRAGDTAPSRYEAGHHRYARSGGRRCGKALVPPRRTSPDDLRLLQWALVGLVRSRRSRSFSTSWPGRRAADRRPFRRPPLSRFATPPGYIRRRLQLQHLLLLLAFAPCWIVANWLLAAAGPTPFPGPEGSAPTGRPALVAGGRQLALERGGAGRALAGWWSRFKRAGAWGLSGAGDGRRIASG